MPRFYFHAQTHRQHLDEIGSELHDLAAAKTEAKGFFGDLIVDAARRPSGDLHPCCVTVTDGEGVVVHTIRLDSVDRGPEGVLAE